MEEIELVDYCENSKKSISRKFLLEFYIRRGRFSEALEFNEKFFANDSSTEEDQKRISIMKNILLCLPPALRDYFRISGPKLAAFKTALPVKPVALSQSTAIRGKSFNQQELLKALQDNYVHNIPPPEKIAGIEIGENNVSMDVDNTFEQENTTSEPLLVKTPAKSISEQEMHQLKGSRISSPFVKQPYTPPIANSLQYFY